MRLHTSFLFSALAMAAALVSHPASAQTSDDTWLVVVGATEGTDLERLGTIAHHTQEALRASAAVVSGSDGAERLEATESRAFRPLPPAFAQRLADTAESMLQDLVSGSNHRARALGEPLLSEARALLPAIGRDESASRHLSDICLLLVRSHLGPEGPIDRGAAETQALECLAVVPGITSDRRHPPEVGEVLEAQRASLSEDSAIVIQAAASDPAGCAIRINGRVVGTTPFAQTTLPAGRYRAQVECAPGAPSRVRDVRVSGAEPTRVIVDGRFDSTLRVDTEAGMIALAYATTDAMQTHLAGDVARVAGAVRATRVLVVAGDSGVIRLERFTIGPDGAHSEGTSPVAAPVDAERSRRALATLLGGEVPDEITSVVASSTDPISPGSEHTDGLLVPAVVSFVLGGVGLATFGTLGGLALGEDASVRRECGDAHTCTPERVQGIHDLALGADIALGIGVGALAIGGILLAVSPPRDVAVAVVPVAGPTLIGASASGSF